MKVDGLPHVVDKPWITFTRAGVVLCLVFVSLVAALFFFLGVEYAQGTGRCPTEDSCQMDYRDGSWHLVEVTP